MESGHLSSKPVGIVVGIRSLIVVFAQVRNLCPRSGFRTFKNHRIFAAKLPSYSYTRSFEYQARPVRFQIRHATGEQLRLTQDSHVVIHEPTARKIAETRGERGRKTCKTSGTELRRCV